MLNVLLRNTLLVQNKSTCCLEFSEIYVAWSLLYSNFNFFTPLFLKNGQKQPPETGDHLFLSGCIRVRIPQKLDVVTFWSWNLDVVVFCPLKKSRGLIVSVSRCRGFLVLESRCRGICASAASFSFSLNLLCYIINVDM